MAGMFIRQTRTNNKATGEGYFTFRLVRGERIAGKVRQVTVLNLGRHFPVVQDDWPLLCSRLEQLLAPQALLCTLACPDHIERAAQRYYAQLIARAPLSQNIAAATVGNTPALADPARREDAAQPPANSAASQASAVATPASPDIQSVDIDSLELSQPRSVGVEHVALHAIAQLGLVEKLTALGLSAVARACILGNLIKAHGRTGLGAGYLGVAKVPKCPGRTA